MTRTLLVLVVLLISVGVVPAERPGYLSAGRLAPLRFAEAPSAQRFLLPPCSESAPSRAVSMPTNGVMACASQVTTVSSSPPAPMDEAPNTNDVFVTPQMLMGYYRDGIAGTNRTGGAVVPFGFVPPAAAAPQSSTASYSSP
jgi:hypothetical protein